MHTARAAALLVAAAALPLALAYGQGGPQPSRATVPMTWAEAGAAFETWPDTVPAELAALSPAARATAWPEWLRRRDGEIRSRIDRGDEDSVVNLWLYGTSFTNQPRAVASELTGSTTTVDALVEARLDDLLDGLQEPQPQDRLHVVREVLQRHRLEATTAAGREGIRRFLRQARARMIAEFADYDRRTQSASGSRDRSESLSLEAVLYRQRGLSTDASLLVNYGVERALDAIAADGSVARGAIRHIGIVGPGLEFANKAGGTDSYPQQTVQPFAAVDAAVRHRLAGPDVVRVTALDVNPRVISHLDDARQRAAHGEPYLVHVALGGDDAWSPGLLEYAERFGGSIGEAAVPPATDALRRRLVRFPAAVVQAIVPQDVNVVLERPAPAAMFDLVIATNVLVYYSRFEQALALTNLAAMLRPGGVLLTNTAVFPVPPFQAAAHHLRVVYSDRQADDMFWYRRN